jgi:hypothetical protein
MYYVLHCPSPANAAGVAMLTHKRDHPLRSWSSGKRFSANPSDPPQKRAPPEPVRAEIKAGYEKGVLKELIPVPVPLMTKRLHKALQDAGVSNVDTYRAEILDPATGKMNHDYVAFNVIGVVAAADLKRSSFDASSPERMISMGFDSLAIDAAKAQGALLFRLAENVGAIVVHEKVRKHLEATGIDTLTFIPPEEWAG